MYEGYTKAAIVEKCKKAAKVLREHAIIYEEGEWERLCYIVRIPPNRTFVRYFGPGGLYEEDIWIDLWLRKHWQRGKTQEEIAVLLETILESDIHIL